ncbi:MAG: type II toxin-antitoxin system HicA family toxin [Acidobacteriota bacterium]|nr:type II toxin-antitoxin system HicA family toxin [Acidobacteriota bacterium]
MKLPRDLSGVALSQAPKVLGYKVIRQTGSHLRLTTTEDGEHHVTIPRHDALRIGTLAAVLDDVAAHFKISRDELLTRIKL